MELARENLNESLDWLGVVLNMADLRMVHTRETLDALRESFGDKVFQTVIRRSIRYPESAERGVSILDYRPELGADYIASPTSCSHGSATRSRASACARCARRWSRLGRSPPVPPTRRKGRAGCPAGKRGVTSAP